MSTKATGPYQAHFGGGIPTMMGVVGSLGTADTGGTAKILPVGVRESSGAMYVYNLGPAGSVTLGDTPGGTLDVVSEVTNIVGGTITAIEGTVTTTASVAMTDIPGGTLDVVSEVTNIVGGTITAIEGTVTTTASVSMTDIPGGTLDLVTGIGTLGSISNIAKVHNAGTIAGLPDPLGSVVMTVGTVAAIPQISVGTLPALNVTAGTLSDLPGGTVDAVSEVTNIVGGTITAIEGTVTTTTTLGDLTGGTVDLITGVGTLGSISNIAKVHNAGTIAALPQVSVGTVPQISVGTLPTLALDTGTVTTGSLANIAYIHEIGTMPAIAIGESTGGTLDLLTTVSNITNGSVNILTGTIQSSGTTTGVGVVSNVTNGSINILTGTVTSVGTVLGIAGGSLANIGVIHNAGTVTSVTSVANLVKGTITRLEGGTVGLVTGVGTLGSISNIAKVHNAGTIAAIPQVSIGTLSNLPGGTVGLVTGMGTLGSISNVAVVHNAGTLQAGTVQINPKPTNQVLTVSALGTAGGSQFGTLSAVSGAGTYHYVTGLQVVQHSGTSDIYVGYGTSLTGAGVLARGRFTPGGGIARDFSFPIQSGTNTEICYEFAEAGTAYIAVNYYKATA